MGIIFSDDIVLVANAEITARSVASGYAKVNVMNLWHSELKLRANDLTQSDANPLIYFDMGSATTITSVALLNVNFDKTRIRGHASDLSTNWSGSTFDSGSDVSVSQNLWNGRYNIFIPLSSFNYQWLAVMTPAAASAVGSYTTKWEIGTIVLLDSETELSKNMAYGYNRTTVQPYQDVGRSGRVNVSTSLAWQADLVIGPRSSETAMKTFNRINMGDPILYYENSGSTQDVYLCLKDNNYEGEVVASNVYKGNIIRLREIV